ncbi:MAG: hypothetical protein MK008_11970 [Bdellovibrionales bacterium]|nr:hypothetical protein [Bdellovibrionales bacterium]
MGLEEIREDLKDQLLTTWEQVRDSSTFMSLKEKYEIMPQQTQKLIKILGGVLLALILFMLPYGYYSSSKEQMQRFEKTRLLLNDLLEAQSAPTASTPAPPSLEALRTDVQGVLNRAALEQEQIVTVSEDTSTSQLSFKNKDIQQRGLKVEFVKLILNQIVNIGSLLQGVHQSAKLIDIQIEAVNNQEEQGYFNVSYFLKTFEVPMAEKQQEPTRSRRPRGGS